MVQRILKWIFSCLVLLSSCAFATNLTANLKNYTGGSPTAFVRLELRGCSVGSINYLPNVSGVGVFVGEDRGGMNIFPDSNGLISGVTVQDQSTIACAGIQGTSSSGSPIYYHISVWSGSQSRPLARTKLVEGDFDIFGSSFNLNSAVSKISVSPALFGGNATAFFGAPLKQGAPANGNGYFYNSSSGKFELSTPSGTGGSVNVNGSLVSNPNFNITSPVAEAAFVNCKWQVSGTDVSLECPQGTSSTTFAAGNDSRITSAVPNTRTVNSHALSADVTVSKSDVGLGSVDNTADTAKPVSTAQQTAIDAKANHPASSCANATTDKLVYNSSGTLLVCATDQTSGAGTGITSLNGNTAVGETMDNGTDDANFILRITQNTSSNNRFTISYTGTALAKVRQFSATMYTDQANTLGAFLQDFSASTLKLPHTAGASPTTAWLIQGDDTSNTLEVGINGVNKVFAFLDSTVALASAAAANPGNCSGVNFPKGVDASWVAEGCTAVLDSDLSTSDISTNNATASKHGFLPRLSGVSTEFLNGSGAFATPPGSDPTTTQGDISYRGASGLSRLAGSTGPDGVPLFYVSQSISGVAGNPFLTLSGLGGRTVTTTPDPIVVGDRGKCVIYNSSSSQSVSLPAPSTSGFGTNFYFCAKFEGSGAVTITPTSGTIQGISALTPNRGETCRIYSVDNTNYRADCTSGQITFSSDLNATRSAVGMQINLAGTIGSNTTGTSSNVSGTPLLPNGTTAADQTQGDNSGKISNTKYVDLAVSNALAATNPAVAVSSASTASLTGTYANGSAGIGATFTVTATGAFTLDGVSISAIGQRVLLKNQSSGFQNGVYTATVVGATGVSPVFTRASDYNTPSNINSTGAVPVQSGTANVSTSWLLTSSVTTLGTDAITFTQFTINPSSLVTASSPGAGLGHFSGGTQALTSSLIVAADVTANTLTHSQVDSTVLSSDSKADVLLSATYCADAGANDTYTCSLTPAITAYVAGKTRLCFKANTANTGASSINFNSIGALTIKRVDGNLTTDLSDNDIVANQIVCGVYDGTNFEMLSRTAAATGTGARVQATSPTLVTPTLGVATVTSVNKMAVTAPTTSSTLAVADGKTFTSSNTITLTGTDGASLNVSNAFTTGTVADVLDAGLFCSDAGSTDTYACSFSPAITSYVTGVHYRFKAATANTGAATININSLGAKTIKKRNGNNITTDLADNDIPAGGWVDTIYDGTNMQMQSQLGNAGSSGTPSFPVTVAGTTTSGGIPYFSSTTVESSSGILNSNILVKGGGAGAAPTNSLITDDGTSATYTGTGGYKAPAFTSTGTTAGFVDFPQGTTSAAVAPCNVATSICEQAPTSVTSYLVTKPGVSASGIRIGTVASAVITEGFSGDSNHSATVTTGSGTSIGSTSLCSTTFCPAGLYRVNVYIDITTACGTTGTYVVNLIYTDDQGSKTVPVNLEGTGSVPATGVITTTSTANFGYDAFVLRSTGAASINYSTTAVACGTAGPMVGKLYLSVEPLM